MVCTKAMKITEIQVTLNSSNLLGKLFQPVTISILSRICSYKCNISYLWSDRFSICFLTVLVKRLRFIVLFNHLPTIPFPYWRRLAFVARGRCEILCPRVLRTGGLWRTKVNLKNWATIELKAHKHLFCNHWPQKTHIGGPSTSSLASFAGTAGLSSSWISGKNPGLSTLRLGLSDEKSKNTSSSMEGRSNL